MGWVFFERSQQVGFSFLVGNLEACDKVHAEWKQTFEDWNVFLQGKQYFVVDLHLHVCNYADISLLQ